MNFGQQILKNFIHSSRKVPRDLQLILIYFCHNANVCKQAALILMDHATQPLQYNVFN